MFIVLSLLAACKEFLFLLKIELLPPLAFLSDSILFCYYYAYETMSIDLFLYLNLLVGVSPNCNLNFEPVRLNTKVEFSFK